MPIIQFHIHHDDFEKRAADMAPYANDNVLHIGGRPDTNCAQVSLYMMGLVDLRHVEVKTRMATLTHDREVADDLDCVLKASGYRGFTITIANLFTAFQNVETVYTMIGKQLKPEYGTILLIGWNRNIGGHFFVFYKDGFGNLRIVDQQIGFDGDHDAYPNNRHIGSISVFQDVKHEIAVENPKMCLGGPMDVSIDPVADISMDKIGGTITRGRRPLSGPTRKGRRSSSAKKRRYSRRQQASRTGKGGYRPKVTGRTS